MTKPTIIFAVQLPPPVHGSSLMNELIVNSHEVKSRFNVIVLPIQMARDMEDMGVFSFKKIATTIQIYIRQIRLFSRCKADLFYITLSPLNFAFYKDFILVTIAKLFNKKILIHLHGQGIRQVAQNNFLKRKMYEFVFKNTQVICLAKPLWKDIENVYNGTPYFLSNGIKVEKNLNFDKKETDFLYLSNLMSEKGINIFLQTLLSLHKKGLPFKAEIIGESADCTIEEAIEFTKKHGLNHKVKILGPIYGRSKYNHLSNAKVLVLPSFKECFPLTILEAYQAKTAVIATNTGGIPDIIEDKINGYVVEPKNGLELEEKMMCIIKDEALYKKMGELNFIKFEKKYTQEIFIANFVKILECNLHIQPSL